MRDFCGVLLGTPHFKLAGITTDGVGHRPKLRVCNAFPCSYQEICVSLVRRMKTIRYDCDDQAIRSIVRPEIATRPASPTPPRIAARPVPLSEDAAIAAATDVVRRLTVEPSLFRLGMKPEQQRRARVALAKGVAILGSKGLTILKPGLTIPKDALIVSEEGAMLHVTINRATVPVKLTEQQLPEGSIEALDRHLATVPKIVGELAIKAARAGAPLREIARAEHAISRIPSGTIEAALSSSFPYGSAGEPIRPVQSRTTFDDKALQKRFEAVRRMQQ